MKSVIKSTYKAGKYVASYVVGSDDSKTKNNLSWQSYIIMYKHPKTKKLIIDQAYIFVGNMPANYHSYYINFVNWEIMYKTLYINKLKIDPDDIHLHIKIGNTPFDIDYFIDNPTYYLHFFPNPKSRIYKAVASQLDPNKIKVIDLTEHGKINPLSIPEISKNIIDPRFKTFKHQVYGKKLDNVIFTGINVNIL